MLFRVLKILANTLRYICYFGESKGKKLYTVQKADFFCFVLKLQSSACKTLILYTWIGQSGEGPIEFGKFFN